MPRLVKRTVLEDAIRDGVVSITWATEGIAYADGHDGQRYIGLRAGEIPSVIAASGLVVHPDAANSQLETEKTARASTMKGDTGNSVTAPARTQSAADENNNTTPSKSDGPAMPTRYYGRVTVGSDRWTKTAADIAEAVVNQLAQAEDTNISVTIEIEANTNHGFDSNLQRTITENAATLKFKDSTFEP